MHVYCNMLKKDVAAILQLGNVHVSSLIPALSIRSLNTTVLVVVVLNQEICVCLPSHSTSVTLKLTSGPSSCHSLGRQFILNRVFLCVCFFFFNLIVISVAVDPRRGSVSAQGHFRFTRV